ncbi:aldolase [Metabacillus sp. KIGAM252]|uniref:Aldolase n=1 Tax=Metabacillus flavus TaxID=2823519 RepID=A0ABS5LFX0_9BACI|nr:aldolase [Metabacillus flavus]MBS2969642.1 aldolase [Metabacillus flavus]
MREADYENCYSVYGLNVSSFISFPELIKIDSVGTDVSVNMTDLTDEWNASCLESDKFLIRSNIIMFRIADTAIFKIENGNSINVSPMPGSDIDKIRLFILGSCFGALLIQRRILPLHGSSIAIGGKAYAIVGESGAGKSTLASTLIREGYKLLSDDVIAVSIKNRIPFAAPAYPQQKLWEESLELFEMEPSLLQPLFERETKYAVPVNNHFYNEPLELAGIFELTKTEDLEIKCMPLTKLEKLHALSRHTYRNFFVNRLGMLDWHFSEISRIANHADVFLLSRPANGRTAEKLMKEMLNKIEKVGVR